MSGLPDSVVVEDLATVDFSNIVLPMLVIYDRPSDFPTKFVARIWDMDTPTNAICLFDSLEQADGIAIQLGFHRIGPSPGDDPKIAAVYV